MPINRPDERPPVLGVLISFGGSLIIFVVMIVLGVQQLLGLVHIELAWWLVMALSVPVTVFVGAVVFSAQRRAHRRRQTLEATRALRKILGGGE